MVLFGKLLPALLVASWFMLFLNTNVHGLVLGSDNSDWVLSDPGDSCDDACSMVPGDSFCNVEGMNQVNTDVRMRYVDNLFGGQCELMSSGVVFNNEPSIFIDKGTGMYECIYVNPGQTTTCNESFGIEQRYCCCGSNCPVEEYIEPTDWVLSEPGANCNQACDAINEGSCNV